MDTADRLERIAATLADRGVNFVVIGGWAVEAQGYELGYKTEDIDFTPDLGPDNLDRLSQALYDLDAKIRVDDQSLAFSHTGESLGRARVWNLTCDNGDFDLTFHPSGLDGYRELIKSSHLVSVEVDGHRITFPCADLADIVHSKKTADRPKDNQVLPLLEGQLEQRNLDTTRHLDQDADLDLGL